MGAKRAVRDDGRPRMLIVESGGQWPDWLGAAEDDARPLLVISSTAPEPPIDLAFRALHRMAGLEHSALPLSEAVIAVGNGASAQDRAGRQLVTRAVIAHLLAAGGGQITFAIDGGADAARRVEVLELVHGLAHDLGSRPVSFQIRFQDPAEHPKSGVYARAVPDDAQPAAAQ